VILDRAVPHIDDGLKPVQRRILHTFWEQDDGRFHKVANIVGACMRFHPHGDASIGAALVGMGQRGWLVEPQGNFGNMLTGDEAAAPRYIEARLTAFAQGGGLQPQDHGLAAQLRRPGEGAGHAARQVPLVLLDGAEGIAVGLSTRILPHNFNDLCRAAINHLQGKTLPDRAGLSDRWHRRLLGVQRRRARRQGSRSGPSIEVRSKYLLAITELPYGVTTESLIESILAANAKGKTQGQARRRQHRPRASKSSSTCRRARSTDQVIRSSTSSPTVRCSIAPAACVIVRDNRPGQTCLHRRIGNPASRSASRQDRGAAQARARDPARRSSSSSGTGIPSNAFSSKNASTAASRNRKTWESVLAEIRIGLKPFLKQLRREVTDRGHHPPDRDPDQAHLGLQPVPGRRGDQEDRAEHQGDQGQPQAAHRIRDRLV
jgi:topoisomerase-4 subunit A